MSGFLSIVAAACLYNVTRQPYFFAVVELDLCNAAEDCRWSVLVNTLEYAYVSVAMYSNDCENGQSCM